MPNRLAGASSPYLLQHADNPVEWRPWDDEAFRIAKEEGKPVFLSIGYASCHWCHVMAHESFEDDEVAEILNRAFVCVKVDKEELPDVDEAYMAAAQLQTGRGGWPLTAFLTPDKNPFFVGTYFPKRDRGRIPGLMTLLVEVEKEWRTRREELENAAREFAEQLRTYLKRSLPSSEPRESRELHAQALSAATAEFDSDRGGFGDAPKFPPHGALAFLIVAAGAPGALGGSKADLARTMALATLEAMARGGINDHVGGGFHRYSTDAAWRLPHFEKSLLDNALFMESYSAGAGLCESSDPALSEALQRVAQGIADWLLREMRSADGLFCSALDADTAGDEGLFYTWTADQIDAVLGDESALFKRAFDIEAQGNYLEEATRRATGRNVLFARDGLAASQAFRPQLRKLQVARQARPRPSRDEKCLVGWNGLAIAGLVSCGRVEEAEKTAAALWKHLGEGVDLPRYVSEGTPHGIGYLEDAAGVCWGCVALWEATGKSEWRDAAERAAALASERFSDAEAGGFFGSSQAHESLFGRTKPVLDQPGPSANALLARCLLRLGASDLATRTVRAFHGWMQRAPTATMALHAASLEASLSRLAVALGSSEGSMSALEDASHDEERRIVEVSVSGTFRCDGAGARGAIKIRVPKGMHVNSENPPARWLVPTSIESPSHRVQARFPKAEEFGFHGDFVVELTIADARPGEQVEVVARFQVCDDRACHAPEERRLTVLVGE